MKRGDVISGYTILSMLGEGGMARVFEVEKDSVKYAMKVCVPQYEDDVPRFQREYRMLASIHHQNVITVFDEGEVDGVPYYIMERGQASLADLANRELSEEDKFKYVLQVCQGVEAIHSSGVIHRDLKPNNVISCNGVLKVSDFGLGRFVQRDTISLTVTGSSMGSYGYAAPELNEGNGAFKEGSPLLDIYALGGIIYYVFSTGARPDMINPRNVDADILSVVYKCREQEPSERFQSVQEVRAAIEAIDRSRHSYTSISEVLSDTSLSDAERADHSLSIFVKSNTIREVLDAYVTLRQGPWDAIKMARPDYATVIANTALKVFTNDGSTWIQFNDVDIIAGMTATLVAADLPDDVKVSLFKIALTYAVDYNRWQAMRTLYNKIITQWDVQSVKPYAQLILGSKDMFDAIADAIGVSMPPVVKKYWEI
jgi:serine/threonine protein kinase